MRRTLWSLLPIALWGWVTACGQPQDENSDVTGQSQNSTQAPGAPSSAPCSATSLDATLVSYQLFDPAAANPPPVDLAELKQVPKAMRDAVNIIALNEADWKKYAYHQLDITIGERKFRVWALDRCTAADGAKCSPSIGKPGFVVSLEKGAAERHLTVDQQAQGSLSVKVADCGYQKPKSLIRDYDLETDKLTRPEGHQGKSSHAKKKRRCHKKKQDIPSSQPSGAQDTQPVGEPKAGSVTSEPTQPAQNTLDPEGQGGKKKGKYRRRFAVRTH